MNKLVIILSVCIISPVFAMDVVQFTEKESQFFASHLKMAVGFGHRMVAEGKISEKNPMHVILCTIQNDFSAHNGDFKKMISSDPALVDRIKEYQKVDSHPFVQFGLEQVRSNVGNVEEAKKFVIRFRLLSAGLDLTKMYPAYSNAWMGEVQKEERINYMLRNNDYPLDDLAVKDFIALFLYQTLLAPRVD